MTSGLADARAWANALVQKESRGAGDTENAMRRLEKKFGIPWRVFWQLRYKPPSDVLVGVYLQLSAAYQVECERQERLLRHEREITRAKVQALASVGGAAAAQDRGKGGTE